MQSNNKLRMAIRATAAVAVMGVAGQAGALTLDVGDDTEASLYGFARLNMSYDLDDNRAVSTRAGSFTPANEEIDGHFGADVQQSRLGVKVNHSSGVMVNVEGDFRGSGNSAGSLRMRHAYGTYNNVLAGRTWSNTISFVAFTPTLDFDGIAGSHGSWDRTEQVRYTTGPMSFAIEDPSAQAIVDGSGRTSAPAFTARFEDSADAVSFAASASASQVTADDGTNDDSAIGFSVHGSAKLKLSDMFSVQGSVNYTDGATGYLWRSGSNYYGPSAYMDGTSIETIEAYGGNVGVSMALGGGSSINVAYGMTTQDLDDAVANSSLTDAAPETNQNLFVNYMWTPVQNVMMGVEYGYFDQETVAGDSADANRLMFAAQYSF
ncbi:DcaP family trimeric outer membrane transporter [Marinobacter sp.]|uniref:DcaP family trimeric outer membrane transporter n=1 Tax=Marinobacter sp. TaxID=50741 RepID=UPI00356960FC